MSGIALSSHLLVTDQFVVSNIKTCKINDTLRY